MRKRYVVRLESEERADLGRLVSVGKGAAAKLTHARILLQADVSAAGCGCKDAQIAEGLGVTTVMVENVRRRFVEEGFEAALVRKRQCRPSRAPDGRARWTLQLLADRLVELKVVDSISYETVRRTLQKTS